MRELRRIYLHILFFPTEATKHDFQKKLNSRFSEAKKWWSDVHALISSISFSNGKSILLIAHLYRKMASFLLPPRSYTPLYILDSSLSHPLSKYVVLCLELYCVHWYIFFFSQCVHSRHSHVPHVHHTCTLYPSVFPVLFLPVTRLSLMWLQSWYLIISITWVINKMLHVTSAIGLRISCLLKFSQFMRIGNISKPFWVSKYSPIDRAKNFETHFVVYLNFIFIFYIIHLFSTKYVYTTSFNISKWINVGSSF